MAKRHFPAISDLIDVLRNAINYKSNKRVNFQ